MSSKLTPFPRELLQNAMLARGGTGSVIFGASYNEATDSDLIDRIQKATDLYPALRTLSYRLPTRRNEDGSSMLIEEQVRTLEAIMDTSVAASAGAIRHDDWLDRRSRIRDLVESANEKHNRPDMNEETARLLAAGESFIDRQRMIASVSRPIGPQRETSLSNIEKRVAEMEDTSEFEGVTAQGLGSEIIPPINWIVPGMIPEQSSVSVAGTSNVGKTRWLAGFAAAGAVGDTARMGLPQCDEAFSSLWLANEERRDDIRRRIKAAVRQHGDVHSLRITIRGKDTGMLRLVVINEAGNPEIGEENVAKIVFEARRINARLIIFDPYVTLSDAMDENAATSAAMLTNVFVLISSMTGAAVLHAHHTPKDRSKDNDWYRGDSGAWRGSGAIYSALDCGFTLANWMPKNSEQRKRWKQQYLDEKLSRLVVLDTGKIREGAPLKPVVYELVGQDMDEGEGDPIGVCELSSEHTASNVLLDADINVIAASELAKAMLDRLGEGEHNVLAKIHKSMRGIAGWPGGDRLQGRDLEGMCSGIFIQREVMADGDYGVKFESKGSKGTKAKWAIVIKKVEEEVE